MRKLLSLVLIAASILTFAPFAFTGGDADGRAIVMKSIKAVGGADKLAKHQNVQMAEKGIYYGMGEGLPYTSKVTLQYPDKFRMEIEGVFTIVLNGDKGWVNTMGDVKEMDKDQLAVQQHDSKAGWIQSLAPLTDKAFTLKKLDDAKVDGKTANVVQVTRKGYPEVKLYFDSKSSFLVKSEYKTKSAEMKFKEVTMESYFTDYRKADGVMTPHKMVMKRDGKIFVESETTSLKTADKLDASLFAMPK